MRVFETSEKMSAQGTPNHLRDDLWLVAMREYCITVKRPEAVPLLEVILVVDILDAASRAPHHPGSFR